MTISSDRIDQPRTPRAYLRLFFTGVAMGAADIIPGVSGGTMAFILGVYEALVDGIKAFDLKALRLVLRRDIRGALEHIPLRFLIALGSGLMTAVFTLARALDWLLDNEPVLLFAFFFGLVIAAIIAIGAAVRWRVQTGLALLTGALAAYAIVGLVPVEAGHDPLTLFFSGALAIVAMILPGISGSFILLIIGQYAYVLESVKNVDLAALVPVAVGAVVGITAFSRILSWLLKRYEQVTVALLIGFMVGSLRRIWPWKETLETAIDRHGEAFPIRQANILPDFASTEFVIALALCLLAIALVSLIDHQQGGKNPFLRRFARAKRAAPNVAVAK